MLKLNFTRRFGCGSSNFRILTPDVVKFSLSQRNLSLSKRCNADEEGSRRARSTNAFQELTSSAPRPSNINVNRTSNDKSKSFNFRRIEVTETSARQRQASRDLNATRRMKPNESNSGGRFRPTSNAGNKARAVAAKFSARVRKEGFGVGNRQQSRNRSLRGIPRKPRLKPWEEEMELPFNEEETQYSDIRDGGFTTPYNPDTNEQNLARHCPAVISNGVGITDSIRYKLAVATDNISPQYRIASQHLMRIYRGNGTLFEDPEQKRVFQEWKDKLDRENAAYYGVPYTPEKLGSLSKKTQEEIIRQWVAGQFEAPALISPENPLTYVRNYAKRNETWLDEDTRKFEAKLVSLLPSKLPPT
ncbi:hypothetical protein EPUL_003444 [Erysiphe pulchra]|uniref:Uncharacterized protein n=1 Tax=Erysiphe pulchra TaxID=225359 RepID=A0A2S4PPA8_9PEZI|nr:hypothetical protein EPUL_003444 [Erysiphe pulchra]